MTTPRPGRFLLTGAGSVREGRHPGQHAVGEAARRSLALNLGGIPAFAAEIDDEGSQFLQMHNGSRQHALAEVPSCSGEVACGVELG
jgi:hypothetical protein